MPIGTVKKWFALRAFGFVQPLDGGDDVFFHASDLERAGLNGLVVGQRLSFDVGKDKDDRRKAVNLKVVD